MARKNDDFAMRLLFDLHAEKAQHTSRGLSALAELLVVTDMLYEHKIAHDIMAA